MLQDADIVGAEQLGSATFPAKLLLDGKQHSLALKLLDQGGAPVGKMHKTTGRFEQAVLHLTIKYSTVEQMVSCRRWVRNSCSVGLVWF
jgi:hypothetical protein